MTRIDFKKDPAVAKAYLKESPILRGAAKLYGKDWLDKKVESVFKSFSEHGQTEWSTEAIDMNLRNWSIEAWIPNGVVGLMDEMRQEIPKAIVETIAAQKIA